MAFEANVSRRMFLGGPGCLSKTISSTWTESTLTDPYVLQARAAPTGLAALAAPPPEPSSRGAVLSRLVEPCSRSRGQTRPAPRIIAPALYRPETRKRNLPKLSSARGALLPAGAGSRGYETRSSHLRRAPVRPRPLRHGSRRCASRERARSRSRVQAAPKLVPAPSC